MSFKTAKQMLYNSIRRCLFFVSGYGRRTSRRFWPATGPYWQPCTSRSHTSNIAPVRLAERVRGALNSSPQNWIFNSVSVYSSPHSYLFGNLSKDVFERRTSTGSKAFSLFICLDANKFSLLTFFPLLKTIYLRVLTKPQPNDTKSQLPVDVRRSKTLLLKLTIYIYSK